jgi:hypothetical protein
MKSVVFYDPATGRIVSTGVIQDHMIEANTPSGCSYLESLNANPKTDYVLNGVVTPRQAMQISVLPTELSVNEVMTITGVPVGSVLHHPDGVSPINDGTIEWSTNAPGLHTFLIVNTAYLEEYFRVEVYS